jgi:hypothetical protein
MSESVLEKTAKMRSANPLLNSTCAAPRLERAAEIDRSRQQPSSALI